MHQNRNSKGNSDERAALTARKLGRRGPMYRQHPASVGKGGKYIPAGPHKNVRGNP